MCNTLSCLAAAVVVGAASATSQPTLDHNAPFLGHTLELTVDGAPASQPLVLFYSPHAGDSATPWGTLEIERASSQRIALGTTDAQGHAAFAIPVPADASLAENEAHFQALIDDPSAPAGKTLSHGVHVRLLGTRLYATGNRVVGSDTDTGIEIVSAVRAERVAQVDLGVTASFGRPVFDARFSRGAVAASGRLALFDPFFGTLIAMRELRASSSTLCRDARGESALVLETGYSPAPGQVIPGRVSRIDLTSGATSAFVDLPFVAATEWCSNPSGSEVFVVEQVLASSPTHAPALLRIDTATLQPLGNADVGAPGDTSVTTMLFADGKVFVGTQHLSKSLAIVGSVTRVDFASSPPQAVRQPIDKRPLVLTANEIADRLFVFGGDDIPNWALVATALSSAIPFFSYPHPPAWGPVSALVMDPQDDKLWVLDKMGFPPDFDERARLLRLDLSNGTWRMHAHTWPHHAAPVDMEVARDSFVDQVLLGVRGYGPPIDIVPEIYVLDAGSGDAQHVPIEHSPYALLAVPVP